jgi:hypothetical protein
MLREIMGKICLKILGLKNSLRLFYFLKSGHIVSFKNPQRFNEKIQARKSNYQEPLFSLCADKYAVRKYVSNKIGDKYLIPLLYVGDKITKKDVEKLPNAFVMKTNNASKTNIIVRDKSKEDIELILNKINKYLKSKFWYRSFEMFYSGIKPKVIVEKLLLTKDGSIPNDYKFHVFKNGPTIIQVDLDRMTDHKRAFYNEAWEELDYTLGFKRNTKKVVKPINLKEMIGVAKKLAENFSYVRVDLYNIDGQIYFGELTFTHGSGFEKFTPDNIDYEWGKYWLS